MLRQAAFLTFHDLRVRRGSLIGWSISLALVMAIFVAMFPSVAKIDFEAVASQYPEGLLKAFGISSIDQISTPGGFLNLELFGALLPLALIFLPIGMITHAITNDEESGYLAPLLALPIARRAVMAGAAASALMAMLIAIAVIVAASLLMSLIASVGLEFSDIAQSAIATLPIGMLAAGIATLVAGASHRRGLPTAVAAGAMVGMYLMQVLASFSRFFHDIRGLSAFNYYNEWINSGIEWLPFVLLLLIAGTLMVIGGALFARRDINA